MNMPDSNATQLLVTFEKSNSSNLPHEILECSSVRFQDKAVTSLVSALGAKADARKAIASVPPIPIVGALRVTREANRARGIISQRALGSSMQVT